MVDFYCDQILNGVQAVDVVHETEHVLAFHHTQPFFEAHVVIIPKKHMESITAAEALNPILAEEMMRAIQFVASEIESRHGGCRVSSDVGSYQTTKHLHWYVHAGRRIRHEDGTAIEEGRQH